MRHPLKNKFHLIGLFVALLFLAACTETSTGGGQTPDPDPDPQPTPTTREKAAYNAEKNLIDPFEDEFFDFYTRQRPFPFNPAAVKRMGISQMQVRQYTEIDNEELAAEALENGLNLSKKFQFTFDGEGRPKTFSRLALIAGDPADSASLTFTYLPSGLLQTIDVVSPNGDGQVTVSYNVDRISKYADPSGFSTSYGYDDAQNIRYETEFNAGGAATVSVYGPAGSFSDETAIELQTEILQRQSDFVDYSNTQSLKNVVFVEEENGLPQMEVEMGRLESINGRVRYLYKDNVINQRKYREEGLNAEIEEKRFHYNDFGDLTKVVFNEQDPGIDGVTSVHEFEYDENGRWTKRVHSLKIGVGSTKVDRIDFVTYN